ncbi:DUF3106 domain-containing protein [[Pseudomonas] boreopolis]
MTKTSRRLFFRAGSGTGNRAGLPRGAGRDPGHRRGSRAVAAAVGLLLGLPVAPAIAQALPAPLDENAGGALASPRVDWQAMTPAQRADLRARYRAWRELGDAERARIRQARDRLAALPAEQQRAQRVRFDAMDRLYRDGWRLGPTLGAHYAHLQPLFGYVPPAQRDVLLGLLRSLDAEQLQQLAVISQRTPPQERDALRNELLAQAPAARAAWLRRKLGR